MDTREMFLVMGYGETPLPEIELVFTLDEAFNTVARMVYGDPSPSELLEARADFCDFEERVRDGFEWHAEFEIGGIRAWKVCGPDELIRTLTARSGDDALGDAARDVLVERQRQMSVESWTPEHDDAYLGGDLAGAAACYCLGALGLNYEAFENFWPWDEKWWKPTNHRRDLVKAAALILAEIERLDRAASSAGDQEVGS
jgi:hypothetical protein